MTNQRSKSDEPNVQPGPLDGVRVIEIGSAIAGPLTTMLLAQLGADVVKVEPPNGGDPFRSFSEGGYGPHLTAYNQGKRSVVLDLRTGADRSRFDQLLENADVLVDNYRPGTLARLGYTDILFQASFPHLIRCSVTGFGADGPYALRPSYDGVAQSLAGMLSLFLDSSSPEIGGPTISDNVTAYTAALAISGALFARNSTGKARRVEVNMLDATVAFIPDAFSQLFMSELQPTRLSRVAASQTFTFACADHKFLTVHLSAPEKFWKGLTKALDAPELHHDVRFQFYSQRVSHYLALREVLGDKFKMRTRCEWIDRLSLNDVPHAPVLEIGEVPHDPQVRENGIFQEIEGPSGKAMTRVASPWTFDGKRVPGIARAPLLGEHESELFPPIAKPA